MITYIASRGTLGAVYGATVLDGEWSKWLEKQESEKEPAIGGDMGAKEAERDLEDDEGHDYEEKEDDDYDYDYEEPAIGGAKAMEDDYAVVAQFLKGDLGWPDGQMKWIEKQKSLKEPAIPRERERERARERERERELGGDEGQCRA